MTLASLPLQEPLYKRDLEENMCFHLFQAEHPPAIQGFILMMCILTGRVVVLLVTALSQDKHHTYQLVPVQQVVIIPLLTHLLPLVLQTLQQLTGVLILLVSTL